MKAPLCLLVIFATLFSWTIAHAGHSAIAVEATSGARDSLWVIVISSTVDPADAELVARAFQPLARPHGFRTSIYAVEINGERRFRVTVGSFADRELASQARERVSILPGDAWIWKSDPKAVYLGDASSGLEGADTLGAVPAARLRAPGVAKAGEEGREGEPAPLASPTGATSVAASGALTSPLDVVRKPAREDGLRADEEERLRVYVDCDSQHCDFDFFRRSIPFVDYVRDRKDADAYVLITAQPTGAGGTAFTLLFTGRRDFAGLRDTLSYTALQNDTSDEMRSGLAHVFKIGLIRYLSRTPQRDWLQIAYVPPETESAVRDPESDPWNSWVFKIFAGGSANGEQQFRSYQGYVTPSASHVTERWKIELGGKATRYVQFFEYDGTTYEDILESYSGDALGVRSIGARWSLGLRSSVLRSTFANQDLTLRLAPALEFNIFPYSESSRKRFTFLYEFGVTSFDYLEETLFEKTSEIFARQVLTITLDIKQPWGSLGASLVGNHYLTEHYSVDSDAYVSLRLFRGLSLDVTGGVSSIRDQIYLPKGGATPEEILLRRKELATDYRYFVTLGFGYMFGSIYNNIVNPRFGR